AAPPEPKPPEPLPPLESLKGLESDYKAFMQPGVAEDVKRAAIKKLFADPKFNVMDGLDVYIDDYTQFEPLPAEMLGKIAAVKHLFRSPEPERPAEPAPEGGTEGEAVAPDTSGRAGKTGTAGELPDGSAPPEEGTFRTTSAVLEPSGPENPAEERNSMDS
ncbi:MAG: DUF3306 domain-containing protein, partial [Burkholderiales bacterium]|nr:DUF3306 domain-containing protein [Burkholderiales bacterium]